MAARILQFGGTFDPIHHGHLIVARAVAEYFHFEKVLLIPAAVPPHKLSGSADEPGPGGQAASRVQTPAEDRLAMIRRAIAGEPLFEVSDIELGLPQPSYTFDTLMALREQRGLEAELCWLIGADMLEDLPTWHRAGEVIEMASIITASRPPYSRRIDSILDKLRVRFSADQVARLAGGVVQTPLVDITSTHIRKRTREGKSVRFLTPDVVISYIEEKGLYSARKTLS